MNSIKRSSVAILAGLAYAGAASAADGNYTRFGTGDTCFQQHTAPEEVYALDGDLLREYVAGEPMVGVSWKNDHVFFKLFESTTKLVFNDKDSSSSPVEWTPQINPFDLPEYNLDPILHVNPATDRIIAGAQFGACSVLGFSDDDGQTWLPTVNTCSGAEFDHGSIGSGPPNRGSPIQPVLYPHMTYYCAQFVLTACATSLDGGITYLPFTQVLGDCAGIHGHIRVSWKTGTAAMPFRACGAQAGLAYTSDNGLTWNSRTMPFLPSSSTQRDPSLQFSRDNGILYYGSDGRAGPLMSRSSDEGVTWDLIGQGGTSEIVRVGQFHEPQIVVSTFSDVQVGDDDRVAFSFIGLEDLDGDGTSSEYPDSYTCTGPQEHMIWHYYLAMSYDGAVSWTVQRVTNDPVQGASSVWGSGGQNPCRNLLDFNDMTFDSTGRVYVGIGDGCVGDCADLPTPDADGYRADVPAVIRQETGRGLFAKYDDAEWPVHDSAIEYCNTHYKNNEAIKEYQDPPVIAEFRAFRSADLDDKDSPLTTTGHTCLDRCATRNTELFAAEATSSSSSSCVCGTQCAFARDPAALNCCGDYAERCTVAAGEQEEATVEAVELRLTVDGTESGLDVNWNYHHFRALIADAFNLNEEQVLRYALTPSDNARSADLTVAVFTADAALALANLNARGQADLYAYEHRGLRILPGSVRATRIHFPAVHSQEQEQQEERVSANSNNNNNNNNNNNASAAAASAAEEGWRAGEVAAVALGVTLAGVLAGVAVRETRRNRADKHARDVAQMTAQNGAQA